MDIQTFIDNYQETFSGKAELPIAFWYSDTLSGELRKTQGCLFKALPAIRNGEIISMSGESIGCGGGKFYTGFTPMPEHVPNFVSLKERYKQTPEMVLEGIKKIDVQRATKQYIHFARIDRLTSFEDVEGLLFLATPDILSGLVTWAFFDNNSPEAISTPFGSGCSATITQAAWRAPCFPWLLRSLGPPLCGKQRIEFHDPDVSLQGDVRDDAYV